LLNKNIVYTFDIMIKQKVLNINLNSLIMKKAIKFKGLSLLVLFSLLMLSCTNDDDDTPTPVPTPNYVQLAQSVDDLSSLVAALIQADAGLVGVLSGDGPFTVFAPTNDAFAALLDQLGPDYNSLADFDTAEEKALLAKILTYHVVSGAAALSTDLTDGMTVTTVQGEDLKINLTGGVKIDDATDTDANVTTADAMASNGVVHIIDKVLLPQEALDALGH